MIDSANFFSSGHAVGELITVTEFFTNFEATRACTTRFSFLCSFSVNTQPFLTVNRAACSTLKRLSSLFPR